MDHNDALIRLVEAKDPKAKKKPDPKAQGTSDPKPPTKPELAGEDKPDSPAQDKPDPNAQKNPPGDNTSQDKNKSPGTGGEGDQSTVKPSQDSESKAPDKKSSQNTTEQKSSSDYWPSSQTALLMTASALLATAVCVAFFAMRMKAGVRNEVNVRKVSRDIAEALHNPGLPLDQVANEIRLIESRAAQLVTAHEALKASSNAASQRANDPLRKRIGAAIVFLEDSIRTAAALAADAQFGKVDQVLALQAGCQTAAKELKEAADGDAPAARLLVMLERGSLNAPLTSSSFLEAYFPNHRAWRGLRNTLHASGAALQVLLEHSGVQIVTTPILSIVSATDIREPPTKDIRNVKEIPEVQQTAARMARNLGNREFLIVDCHTPGWISDKLGRRPPQFTVFDPTSWT